MYSGRMRRGNQLGKSCPRSATRRAAPMLRNRPVTWAGARSQGSTNRCGLPSAFSGKRKNDESARVLTDLDLGELDSDVSDGA